MERLLLIFFVVFSLPVSGEGLADLKTKASKKWPHNRAINLVFHGHSVPAGYHVTPEVRTFESYPHLVHVALKKRFPHAVMNIVVTAIGGEASPAGARRFQADVIPHKPDIIFIDYALNDRRTPPETVKASWLEMIRIAKAASVPVVLITPTGDIGADMKNTADPLAGRAEIIRSLATSENVILADVSKSWLAELANGTPEKELLSQKNHPNLRGHLIAADTILKALAEAGL